MDYIIIKILLILGLVLIAYFLMRPVKSANHLALRRIWMMIVVLVAAFAVIFPELLNGLARTIGVASGVNLVVYILVIAVFTQMATSYRRDLATDRKITALSRALALQSAPKGSVTTSVDSDLNTSEEGDPNLVNEEQEDHE